VKYTITKKNGTKLIKEFVESDIKLAEENGWERLYKPKAKTPKETKPKGGK